MQRYDVFVTPGARAAQAPQAPEAAIWHSNRQSKARQVHPLTMYGLRSTNPIGKGKGLVRPEHMAAWEVRFLPGETDCSVPLQPRPVICN